MKKHNRKIKGLFAAYIAILTMITSAMSASALDVSGLISFGDGIVAAIRSISVIICVGAVIVLGLTLVVSGRGWAEKLKSGFAGILIGIILISLGSSLVASLFADAGGSPAVAQIVSATTV